MTDETKGTPLTDCEIEQLRAFANGYGSGGLPARFRSGRGIWAAVEMLCHSLTAATALVATEKERADKAERELHEIHKMGQIVCPCANEQPDPCPACGATVATGICGAGKNPAAMYQMRRAESAEAALISERELVKELRRDAERYRELINGEHRMFLGEWENDEAALSGEGVWTMLDKDQADTILDAALARSSSTSGQVVDAP